MKGKMKPKMMKKMAGKKMAKTDAMPMKGGKGKLMKRLEGKEI